MSRTCLSIILAAGEGTRMKSSLPKVLHPVAHLPIVCHVARSAAAAGGTKLAIVVGHGGDAVRATLAAHAIDGAIHVQTERLGTAHAVLAARDSIATGYDDILVMFGDTPLIEAATLQRARDRLADGADVVVMGFRTANPDGYGRLIEEAGQLVAIREHKDASEAERKITFCNGGLMAFRGADALSMLDAIGNDNAKGEYYLTDIVELARARGKTVVAVDVPFENVLGINTRAELADAEMLWQQRRRRELMLAGVSMQAPDTVFLAHDTVIGRDVVIEPNVWFGTGVRVGDGATIRAFSHIEGAGIGEGCEIGPFARLRPGADLQAKAKVGNFVEVKNADIGPGAKVNHLSYVGDASVGAKANVGAGTITCNYDGYLKHRTEIGAEAFVGSNSSLVAPVRIGAGAIVAAGSVITADVPADAVGFGRAKQSNREGLAKIKRQRLAAAKAAKTAKAAE